MKSTTLLVAYFRERLHGLSIAPDLRQRAGDNLVVTERTRYRLDPAGSGALIADIAARFPADGPVDVIVLDPLINYFHDYARRGENDNQAIQDFFDLTLGAIRDAVNPDAAWVVAHHVGKMPLERIQTSPFDAPRGASAMRGAYTAGMVLYRPDEREAPRVLETELRYGPGIDPLTIEPAAGGWSATDAPPPSAGARTDNARKARDTRHRRILDWLRTRARKDGRLFTRRAAAVALSRQSFGAAPRTMKEVLADLLATGDLRITRDWRMYPGQTAPRGVSEGFLVCPGMEVSRNPRPGAYFTGIKVFPTHARDPATGGLEACDPEEARLWSDGEAPTQKPDNGLDFSRCAGGEE